MIRDLDRYGYVGWERRPILRLPEGQRVAVWVVVNHEVYELDAPVGNVRKPWPRVHPDVLAYSHRDYGNRIGIWRLMEVIDRCGIRGSLNVNVAAFDHFPDIAAACMERGWEVFSHGVYNSRFLYEMSEPQERAVIEDCIESISRHTGQAPRGWMGPMGTMTARTLDLLSEYGFLYTVELFHEDVPFPVKVKSGRLVSVPYTQEVNDIAVIGGAGHPPAVYSRMIREQFDRLYMEGAASGVVMCVALHPFLMGQPHRVAHLEEALRYIARHEGVWLATGEEIASWYLREYYDTVLSALKGGDSFVPDAR
jgi:peptidoglycan/xylan/chitin deacetylase (PgdA/CDA1 family)